jgi:hypothetical protein
MPRFAPTTAPTDGDTIAADWWAKNDDGTPREFVVIRPTKTFFGTMRASSAGMTAERARAISAGAASVDATAIQRTIMKQMIVRMTDETGADVPVTDEALEGLDEADGAFIAQEIDKRSRPIVPAFRPDDVRPGSADPVPAQELPPGDGAPVGEVAADPV